MKNKRNHNVQNTSGEFWPFATHLLANPLQPLKHEIGRTNVLICAARSVQTIYAIVPTDRPVQCMHTCTNDSVQHVARRNGSKDRATIDAPDLVHFCRNVLHILRGLKHQLHLFHVIEMLTSEAAIVRGVPGMLSCKASRENYPGLPRKF